MKRTDRSEMLPVSRNFFLSAVLAAFAVGVFIGSGFMALVAPAQSDKIASLGRDEDFRFIRPAIVMKDGGAHRPNSEPAPFRYKVKALIDEKVGRHEIQSAAVYFRDLNSGNWFGIGEKEKFAPKNLVKLPLIMAYFKWAESNPLVLRKRLTYNAPWPDDPEQTRDRTGLERGGQYSVNDLIFRMITEDDAAAYALLFANISRQRIDKVFKDLNVEYDPRIANDSLSLRAFASFYRVLFNASYLNEEMSEKALRYLSKSSLKHGMASGIPFNTDIAGKFGERKIRIRDDGKEVELEQMHEFGIIYHPRRPFLIGIMARGDDANALVRIIHDLTNLVYEEIDLQP